LLPKTHCPRVYSASGEFSTTWICYGRCACR
ncbi:uncharacterized protein METZ01_LOCUS477728, partial [marine metagenome]